MSPRISIRLLATQSDQRLVALAREGHERAFEALVHRYRRPLLRYARRMRLSEARAEDVLQQSFMQSWIALSGGASVNDVRSWLYRIVHNVAVNAMRGPAGEAHGELTQAVEDRAGLAGVSNLERTIAMRDALSDVAALPRMQQQAIFLTAVDGQSHDEVAGVLGISEGALRGLLYRARSTLRSAAAALTPPPLLAWASAGASSGGPSAERLAELSAGGGAAGLAGLLFKGAVVAVTAGAVATGTSVLSVHHRARPDAARAHDASTELAASTGSFALASDSQFPRGLAGLSRPAARHERSGEGRYGRRGSSHDGNRHGGGSGERRGGEPAQAGGDDDVLASGDGSGRRSSGSAGRDGSGSGDSVSGSGGRDSSGSGAGSVEGQSSGGRQGSSGDGSGGGGSGGSDALLADSSGSGADSSTTSVTDQTSGASPTPIAGAEGEVATVSADRRSGKGGS
ncbi:MAG TPA: RNA polymerase sigma factor [Solirubrobacteraceae bacterium]|nr:RNA polymerase sigma factor [Solirubrobacteraceae bacterium]